MSESWNWNSDKSRGTVTGRTAISRIWKLNPIWWFGNAVEQNVDQAPWYMPTSPEWLRALCWGIRNPLQNFRAFVVGVQDQNYTVTTDTPPGDVVQRNDIGQSGWQRCTITLPSGSTRTFRCYCCKLGTFYYGTQFSGFWGAKANGIFLYGPVIAIAAVIASIILRRWGLH